MTIPGSSRDAYVHIPLPPCQSIPGFPSNCDYPGMIPGCTHILPHCQSIPGFPSNCDYPGMIPGCTHIHIPLYPPVRVSRDSLVTVTIPGSSRDAHTYTYPYPTVRVSRDSLVTVTIPGCTHILPPYQSIPGFPSNCDYPGMIPGCTHILPHCQSIPGFPSNCDYPGIIPGCICTHTPTPLSEYPGIP